MDELIELENSIKSTFDLVINSERFPRLNKYQDKLTSFFEVMKKHSEPILRQETIRYQGIVLNWTGVIASVYFLGLNKIQLFGNTVTISTEAYAFLGLLNIVLLAIFGSKVYLDLSVTTFSHPKTYITTEALIEEIRTLSKVKELQRYYSNKLVQTITLGIGESFSLVSDSHEQDRFEDDSEGSIPEFDHSSTALVAESRSMVELLSRIKSQLSGLKEHFREENGALLSKEDKSLGERNSLMIEFEKTFAPWNALRDRILGRLTDSILTSENVLELNVMIRDGVKRAVHSRTIQVIVEAAFPFFIGLLTVGMVFMEVMRRLTLPST